MAFAHASAAIPEATPVVSSIPTQLRQLLVRSRASSARSTGASMQVGIQLRSRAKALSHDRALPGVEINDGLRLIERIYPWQEMPTRVNAHFAGFGRIEREQLLSFDTETTGLSGGTGTRAFMIGASDWSDRGLRVRQLLITTMAGELAMLEAFSKWINSETVLVSYNGKSYDSPLLATRYRLGRMDNPLAGRRHLDLLYPVRRRFRGVWENCRLATVEREWLGVLREDDLPGSEAPRAWLDYLRGHSGRNLRRVVEHNDQDLRSLTTLLLRLGETDLLKLEGEAR